jgi:putative acetyltransferase
MSRGGIEIGEDDLSGEEARALVTLHLQGMSAHSPAGHVFALGLAALQAPEVTVWTARIGGTLAGMAALKALGAGLGEIKSMRTHPAHLRTGVAAALLARILAEARARGYARLSLETGSGDAFEPALALYRRNGFKNGPAFADYSPSAFNQFLHLDL